MVRGARPAGRFARTAAMKLSPIKAIELAASRVPGVVSLAQGIPSFDTPEPIKQYVREKLAEGACAKYSLTPGLPPLREAIAESLLAEQMHYDPDGEIIVTCGSIEAIAATLLTVTEPGDDVILLGPSYASYAEVVRMAGCRPRFAALREESNFSFDPDSFAACLSPRARAVLYSNPNNPTGTVLSREDTLAILALADRHGLYVVVDEAYKDFVYREEPYFSPAQLPELRERVIRIYTFSKAYGMTGWRVGYLHSAAVNVSEVLKVHDALVTCAPVISQYAALAALEAGAPHIEAFREAFRERRDRCLAHLDALSDIFDYQRPEGAYFVFPRVKDTVGWARDSQRLAHDILQRARVALVPGVAFGPSGEAHLRINFGRTLDDIDTGFERLTAYFGSQAPVSPRRQGAAVERDVAPEPTSLSEWGRAQARGLAVPYLSAMARAYLRRGRPTVVGIAGSRGKTVLKRVLAELYGPSRHVRTNPRSYNTEIGLPLAVLGLQIDTSDPGQVGRTLARAARVGLLARDFPELLVLELGIRQPGDAAKLLETVRPQIAILTTVTPSYSADLEQLQALQQEMRVLGRELAGSCQFIADGDDPLVADVLAELPAPASAPVLLSAASWQLDADGRCWLEGAERRYAVTREVIGRSEQLAVQAAVCLAERFVPLAEDQIIQFLSAGEGERP